ncbi:hypothetical protein HCU64_15995 [Methylobacterium sp. C25]|uniref:hypothetical protein n=1 Tax=Methylobacterium sp. C25 TaxID=2721622 RepID=UPI001F17EC47|nr:hypothetical protein [Methylobacterium sp. C25]MCE4225259.1 hypothetical protein [Methylobacterium sp. C25]
MSKHLHAELAAGFLRFGSDLGLRPAKWQTADVDDGRMYLHKAEHTHGQSCGPERILELDSYPAEYC